MNVTNPVLPLPLNHMSSQINASTEPVIHDQDMEDLNGEENEPEAFENQQLPQQELRRSTRDRRPNVLPDFVYLNEADFDGIEFEDPSNYKHAMSSEYSEKWIEAMQSELESMKSNNVWELVEPRQGIKPIGCKWVFKTKKDSKGNIERHKARLVAKGFTQQEGVDYNETFSPVSTNDAFRIIMALVAHFDLFLHQMDVKTAFLNGDLSEEIFMLQPEGFIEEGSEHLVCKLNKSIYGLKQASRQWYLKFDKIITSNGFVENRLDECIYLKFSGSKFIFLVLYVDDILLASSDESLLHETKNFLSMNFEMKDLGEASYVLGIEIHRDRENGLLGLSQKAYIEKVLKKFNMLQSNGAEVPVSKGDKLSKEDCPKNDVERAEMKDKPYASVVGSIMYAQVCTRPDLAFSISVLGMYQSDPGIAHWKAAKKVLRYMQRTKGHMLVYKRTDSLELVGYTDSDFAGCKDTSQSTSSFVFMMGGGAVAWKSAKQPSIATSTMFDEYLACYEATSHAMWLKNFIQDLKVVDSIEKPIQLFCDNKGAVFFCKNNKRSAGLKHMKVKYLLVREKVREGLTTVDYINTTEMIADPLNKAIPNNAFHKHVTNMGLLSSFEDSLV